MGPYRRPLVATSVGLLTLWVLGMAPLAGSESATGTEPGTVPVGGVTVPARPSDGRGPEPAGDGPTLLLVSAILISGAGLLRWPAGAGPSATRPRRDGRLRAIRRVRIPDVRPPETADARGGDRQGPAPAPRANVPAAFVPDGRP